MSNTFTPMENKIIESCKEKLEALTQMKGKLYNDLKKQELETKEAKDQVTMEEWKEKEIKDEIQECIAGIDSYMISIKTLEEAFAGH